MAYSLIGMAEHLAIVAVEAEHALEHAMEKACVTLEESAKGAIGTYEFGWPQLAESTVARKANGDTPLEETGALKASITHNVPDALNGYVGTNDPKADWMEKGTTKAPPRPFLGGALIAKEDELKKIFGQALVAAIEGRF